VAAHATNGMKIAGRKATCAQIMCMFKDHLMKLKVTLNVHLHDYFLCFLSLSNLYLGLRVTLFVGLSTLPVMHGKLVILMVILL